MTLQLPDSFIQTIINAYPNGRAWLADLPVLVEQAARRWALTHIQPVPTLSYNFVAFAQRSNGDEVVLKMGPPNRELLSELAALRLFNGDGAVRLLEADETAHAFVLERLRPGHMLVEMDDDEAATHIATGVMQRLWRPAPAGNNADRFIKLSEWFGELSQLRPRFGGGTGPFPARLVERVESLLPDLFAAGEPDILMHGDFHHYNVISSERGWLIIDPKGVIGPRGYECGPFMLNPWGDFAQHPGARQITLRRLDILSEHLGLTRDLIVGWSICHSLLSAWWDLTETNTGGEYAMACGELFMDLGVRAG